MKSSYKKEDVTFLLSDVSKLVKETPLEEKERMLQAGRCYSEMLPEEYLPTEEYQKLFEDQLKKTGMLIASYVKILAEKLLQKYQTKTFVLASLARAGIPIGILLKHYLEQYCDCQVSHYAISIIRGLGIDTNALDTMVHNHDPKTIVFVDGWTGKGAIQKELKEACDLYEKETGIHLDSELAVLADTGHCTTLFGTREDFLIPSACLNSTVSGLVSRTFYRSDIITGKMYHGAKYYDQFESEDVSQHFLDEIEKHFPYIAVIPKTEYDPNVCCDFSGWAETESVREHFNIHTINMVKPGVGETTRVLLRRVPWKILVKNPTDERLKHILMLAKDRGIPVETYPLETYNCMGLIKKVDPKEQGV